MHDDEMLRMLTDYMENGFLENIADMFRHDRELYRMVPAMMADERGRVRIGTVALVESLKEEHGEETDALVPELASLLEHENPTIRADAAYLYGAIGHPNAVPYLREALSHTPEPARGLIEETIKELLS